MVSCCLVNIGVVASMFETAMISQWCIFRITVWTESNIPEAEITSGPHRSLGKSETKFNFGQRIDDEP